MAVSEEESFMDLLKDFIVDQADLRDTAGKLNSVGLTGRALLTLSGSEREHLIKKEAPISKKVKLSQDDIDSEEYLSSAQERDHLEAQCSARNYFQKLLEPPVHLPACPLELTNFLEQKPTMLPLLSSWRLFWINDNDMLTLRVPETSAGIVKTLLYLMELSEATSSSLLNLLTEFIHLLNEEAPLSRQLECLSDVLESIDPVSIQTASQSPAQLANPHMQLFAKCCLLLRWENKGRFASLIDAVSLAYAARSTVCFLM